MIVILYNMVTVTALPATVLTILTEMFYINCIFYDLVLKIKSMQL